MYCMEYFYCQESAINFFNSIDKKLEPKIIQTIDEDVNLDIWIVYFNPPARKRIL